MNVKGLKISDIVSMDWERLNKLSEKDLRSLTNRLVSASNKRIRRLEKTTRGTSSFAYQSVQERGRKFSTRGKNVNQLKQEFKLAKQFLGYKTSTVKGWKEYRTKVEQRTGYATEGESLNWPERTWEKYWEVYRKFEEGHSGLIAKKGTGTKYDSDRIQQMLTEMMESSDKRRSADSFQRMIEDEYQDIYESEEDEDIDDYFDLE